MLMHMASPLSFFNYGDTRYFLFDLQSDKSMFVGMTQIAAKKYDEDVL